MDNVAVTFVHCSAIFDGTMAAGAGNVLCIVYAECMCVSPQRLHGRSHQPSGALVVVVEGVDM
eukprot:7602909-Heterocapsa_arctica.AAC.1